MQFLCSLTVPRIKPEGLADHRPGCSASGTPVHHPHAIQALKGRQNGPPARARSLHPLPFPKEAGVGVGFDYARRTGNHAERGKVLVAH